jgi:geranylgeranyl pyrophosphate synthase
MHIAFDHTQFEAELAQFIKDNCKYAEVLESLLWATLPAGKLFRPKIFYAILHDLKSIDTKDAFYIGAALEIHHAYTLVHDDLPCMDNDQFRRGKLSTHAKFGEWKAVLAGDALLNLSYYALTQLQSPHALKIISLFSNK